MWLLTQSLGSGSCFSHRTSDHSTGTVSVLNHFDGRKDHHTSGHHVADHHASGISRSDRGAGDCYDREQKSADTEDDRHEVDGTRRVVPGTGTRIQLPVTVIVNPHTWVTSHRTDRDDDMTEQLRIHTDHMDEERARVAVPLRCLCDVALLNNFSLSTVHRPGVRAQRADGLGLAARLPSFPDDIGASGAPSDDAASRLGDGGDFPSSPFPHIYHTYSQRVSEVRSIGQFGELETGLVWFVKLYHIIHIAGSSRKRYVSSTPALGGRASHRHSLLHGPHRKLGG